MHRTILILLCGLFGAIVPVLTMGWLANTQQLVGWMILDSTLAMGIAAMMTSGHRPPPACS